MAQRSAAGRSDHPADRAERAVFAVASALPATERRALALVELAGVSRSEAAAELGVAADAVGPLLAGARKTLRRTRQPLAAGGRCERTEVLVSDRIDGVAAEDGLRRLDAHLERCPRCRTHVAILDELRAQLREELARPEPEAEPLPERPDLSSLRVVVPAPEPVEIVAPEPVEIVAPAPRRAPSSHAHHRAKSDTPIDRGPSPRVQQRTRRDRPRRARGVAATLLVLGMIVAAVLGIAGAVDDHPAPQIAPWAQPGAPDVRPAPLAGQ